MPDGATHDDDDGDDDDDAAGGLGHGDGREGGRAEERATVSLCVCMCVMGGSYLFTNSLSHDGKGQIDGQMDGSHLPARLPPAGLQVAAASLAFPGSQLP